VPDTIEKEGSKLIPQILILALVGGGSVTGSRFLDDDDAKLDTLSNQLTTAQREEPAQWAAITELRAELKATKAIILDADDLELFCHRNIEEVNDKIETIEDHTEGKHECRSST
jgi:hypothetical protein